MGMGMMVMMMMMKKKKGEETYRSTLSHPLLLKITAPIQSR